MPFPHLKQKALLFFNIDQMTSALLRQVTQKIITALYAHYKNENFLRLTLLILNNKRVQISPRITRIKAKAAEPKAHFLKLEHILIR